jgi:hypothetical protein
MTRYNKPEDFEAGLRVITPFFVSLGYALEVAPPYYDRGYLLAASFQLPPRTVEVHHQFSLGPVIYRMGDFFIEHTPYLEALGVASSAHYPTYEDNSQAGYPALLHDLQHLLSPFFTTTLEVFAGPASLFMEQSRKKAEEEERRWNSSTWQDEGAKARAHKLFYEKRYAEVVRIEATIRFP